MLKTYKISRPVVSKYESNDTTNKDRKRSSKRKERLRLSNELERRKLETFNQPCNCGCYERERVLVDIIDFYQRIATIVVIGIVAKFVIDTVSERK